MPLRWLDSYCIHVSRHALVYKFIAQLVSVTNIIYLSTASVIHVDFLCLYFLNFTVLYGICLSLASLITSCNIL